MLKYTEMKLRGKSIRKAITSDLYRIKWKVTRAHLIRMSLYPSPITSYMNDKTDDELAKWVSNDLILSWAHLISLE